jgi:NitT/TauT family transport system substrate-binding protein
MSATQTRRRFLTALSSAGAAGFIGGVNSLAQGGRLETTSVRLGQDPSICLAPWIVANELLRADGFTDVRYIDVGGESAPALARGESDFYLDFSPTFIIEIDAGKPITILAGVHVGCFEILARETIRSIPDLKGKTVGVPAIGSGPYMLLASMASYVGLDPAKDIRWVTSPTPVELFADGKIDAFVGWPPDPQDLRARNIGHVIFNSATDRPWSHYFCCMMAGNRDYVGRYPVATKRVMRAILKATDLCVNEPERVAQRIVDAGYAPRYDQALQTLKEIPYTRWREYDPDDTVRFYSLRLRESGVIRATPNKILADGTDWRFFNELKRELKG